MRTVYRRQTLGVTVLELLVTVFVLLIGIMGVIALFPVGVKLSHESTDDVISAMTAQNALAAVRCRAGLLSRVSAYLETDNEDGDVLGWDTGVSTGVEGMTGTVTAVGGTVIASAVEVSSELLSGRSFDVSDDDKADCGLLLLTSGRAQWKLYRLDGKDGTTDGSTISPPRLVSKTNLADFPQDGVQVGDEFRIIGARDDGHQWATVPRQFYGDGGSAPSSYVLGQGAAPGYGYLAIVTRLEDSTTTFRVDVLVYKAYDKTLPPEGNLPAVACYTTMMSSSMLQ